MFSSNAVSCCSKTNSFSVTKNKDLNHINHLSSCQKALMSNTSVNQHGYSVYVPFSPFPRITEKSRSLFPLVEELFSFAYEN